MILMILIISVMNSDPKILNLFFPDLEEFIFANLVILELMDLVFARFLVIPCRVHSLRMSVLLAREIYDVDICFLDEMNLRF